MKAIYRFRSAEKLLDDRYGEFTRIYLADRESLNDPMEGFFNIIFEGDKILWENLFKHFFQSVWFVWSILSIKHGRHSLSVQDVIIGNLDNWSDDFFYKEEYIDFENRWKEFCNKNKMNLLFERLEKCSCPFNIAMLEMALNIASPYVMYHIGLLSESGIILNKDNLSDLLLEFINGVERDPHSIEYKHDFISSISKDVVANYYYSNKNISNMLSKNDTFLLIGCVNAFIDKLVYLCTPHVRLASFSEKFDHPLVWSHYADGTRGVCLIFDKNADYRLQSTGGKISFYHVYYDLEITTLNFFSTLFRINGAQSVNRWQSRGLCLDKGTDLFGKILRPYIHKAKEWEYEGEERLLIEDFMREDKAIDTVNIDQSHIKGVIFGARMHHSQQIAIREKAKQLGLDSLKFYRSVLSEHNQGIRVFDENGVEYMGDN